MSLLSSVNQVFLNLSLVGKSQKELRETNSGNCHLVTKPENTFQWLKPAVYNTKTF